MASPLSLEMRLKKEAKENPLVPVTGDEKIAVFGAAGQIGHKLKPVLDELYPGKVIYCERPDVAAKNGMTPLDVTHIEGEGGVRKFLTENKVRVVISLAALLSDEAKRKPELALKINFKAPLDLLGIAKECGVRKVQIMSSIAAQEFDERRYDSKAVKDAKRALSTNAPVSLHAMPDGLYGLQKTALETAGQMYGMHYGLDVNIPRLGGVLNAHLPWPSPGTTEELDKMIVACAKHAVDGAEGIKDDTEIRKYLKGGKYVPEVSAETTFSMIDGGTLPLATLMLLHKDLSAQHDILAPGAVHPFSEYTVSMKEAASILHELNPEFPLQFATDPTALNQNKMALAGSWPTSQDTSTTEALIGKFIEYDARKSITGHYRRVVEELRRAKTAAMAVRPAPQAVNAHVAT